MVPGDRLICIFTRPHEVGEEFRQWPLHVTVVPWFRVELSSEAVAADLLKLLVGQEPFEIEMGGIEFFGRHKNKRVNLVEEPTPLTGIEQKVRHYLHQHEAWLADETTRQRRTTYRPHVTAQGVSHMSKGGRFRCDQLYIVEQKGQNKLITANIPLYES